MLFFLFSFQRSTPSREVLINITKTPLFCQHLFLNFFHFLLRVSLSPFVIAFFEYSFIFSFILDSVNQLVAKE